MMVSKRHALEAAKAAHIAKADKRWEDAVNEARPHLTYDRNVFYGEADHFKTPEAVEHDANVRKLARLLFTVHDSTRHSLFGGLYGQGIELNSYGDTYSLCGMLEFLRYFIGHEILDDGEPGLGYYRSTVGDEPRANESYVRCGPDDKGAEPYFCRSIDWLREDYPGAEHLTLKTAIESLEFYENKRAKRGESMRKHREERGDKSFWSAEQVAHYSEPSKQQREWIAVIDEITQPETL